MLRTMNKGTNSSPQPLSDWALLKEKYEGDIELKELVVPVSEQDDTTPDIILLDAIQTEEPSAPSKSKRKLSGWEIFGIVLCILFVLFLVYSALTSKPTKTTSKPKQKSQAR